MKLDKIKKLMLTKKDSSDFAIFDSVERKEDFVYVNKQVANNIEKKILVHPDDLTKMKDPNESYIVDAKKEVLLNQKCYMLARAIIVADDPTFNKIIENFAENRSYQNENRVKGMMKDICILKAKDPDEVESILQDQIDEYIGKVDDMFIKITGSEENKKQLRIDAQAVLLAQELKENGRLMDRFGNNLIVTLIDQARKKDKHFLENSFNEYAVAQVDNETLINIENDIAEVSDEKLDKMQDEYVSITRFNNLHANMVANNEEQAQLKAKENVRQKVEDRNSKSWTWFVFRPISNLINYIQVNSAKNDYIRTYIDPEFKDMSKDSYNEEIAKFERAINSEDEIKYQEIPTTRMKLENAIDQKDFQKELGVDSNKNEVVLDNSKSINKDPVKVIDEKTLENK